MMQPTFSPGETNIICTDIDDSLRFYRDVLGFQVVEMEGAAVRLSCKGRHFLLLPIAQMSAPAASYGHMATFSFDLLVDDLAAAVAYLRGHNVTMVTSFEPGSRFVTILDPDGMPIEIIQL